MSFSTGFERRDLAKLERALDALASPPVHVIAVHDQLLARAAVVVGHGGHGTTMRALRHGVPIVGVPGQALDQVPNTRLVEAWGAGVTLPPAPTRPASAAQSRRASPTIASPPTRSRACWHGQQRIAKEG